MAMPKPCGSAFVLAIGLSIGLAGAPAAAQQPGNVENGHALASKLCSGCHLVGNEARGSDQAPPFPVIAKDPDTSLIELHSWFDTGHPTLRTLALNAEQIADINAYLDSLRGAPTPAKKPAPAAKSPLPQAPPDKIGPPIGPKPTQ